MALVSLGRRSHSQPEDMYGVVAHTTVPEVGVVDSCPVTVTSGPVA